MSQRRILVTSALPYANGQIHLGHLVEYLQTDMWVRFQKLRGNRCIYICADDTHGTAIMIRARKEGSAETEVIASMRESHLRDFTRFQIAFEEYGSTNSSENREICHDIWRSARSSGLILEQEVEQLFDPIAGTFLADRFVRGTCPFCGALDQYGDSCEKCGKTYSPKDLVNPRSTLSGAAPELRSENHLFFELEKLHDFLDTWTQDGTHLQSSVSEYLKNFFLNEPLRNWDISRPMPYFGFEIPDFPGHCWYVWYDAPIGYIGTTLAWCRRHIPRIPRRGGCPHPPVRRWWVPGRGTMWASSPTETDRAAAVRPRRPCPGSRSLCCPRPRSPRRPRRSRARCALWR